MTKMEYVIAFLLVGARVLLLLGVIWIVVREVRKGGRRKREE